MHKSATKCNETLGKWYKNKHGASKIIDTLETYQPPLLLGVGGGLSITIITKIRTISIIITVIPFDPLVV
jgi:hypothetical protein